MIAQDFAIHFDALPGQIPAAAVERVIHEALAAAHFPVVDVEYDQTRVIDGPFPQGPPALGDLPVPLTRPPGAFQ